MSHRQNKQDLQKHVVDVFARSIQIAVDYNHEHVTLEHLLKALLERTDVQNAITQLKGDVARIDSDLDTFFSSGFIDVVAGVQPIPTASVEEVIARCIGTAIMMVSVTEIAPVDLLVHLLQCPADDSFAVTILHQQGITAIMLKRFLSHGKGTPQTQSAAPMSGGETQGLREPTNSEEARAILAKFCVNLNEAAANAKIDPLIGREDEVVVISKIVSRRTKNNVMLVGEPGVGKTAIAEGLARKIILSEVPESVLDSTVYSLDVAALVAGTRFRGDFEERMKVVLKALEFVEKPILFIDEIHTMMGAGSASQSNMDVANLLKPALARGTLRCLGSTTAEEFRKHIEKDRALLRRFKRLDVYEPSIADAKAILTGLKPFYEEFHGLTYTDEAISAAVELTARYVSTGFLPDKAIDVMDSAGAQQRILPPEKRKSVIGIEEIETEVASIARIPKQTVTQGEADKLLSLEGSLHESVFGQDQAIAALVDAVFIARAGLREPNKPEGAYLFTGPTGVGKTEVARTLAKVLGVELHKFDMSEYMERHAISRLIGSPPGYVGYGDGDAGSGLLVNAVDSTPHCVILLDEIEKAHPDVFNILLQVMDDGKLTSSSGKHVDFRNVILIMTSNAGASELAKTPIGFNTTRVGADEAKIKDLFTPEFRNRLDAIVGFNALRPEQMDKIVDKFLAELAAMAVAKNVVLTFSEGLRKHLAVVGYDPTMGARPLKRAIADIVKKPLSREMLVGKLKDGGSAVVDMIDGKLAIS